VAVEQPQAFDVWAIRWLVRWLRESAAPSIERAAEIAASLADLPATPQSASVIAQLC
jgi:hypothetical protein